jgi:hypothetical protein
MKRTGTDPLRLATRREKRYGKPQAGNRRCVVCTSQVVGQWKTCSTACLMVGLARVERRRRDETARAGP